MNITKSPCKSIQLLYWKVILLILSQFLIIPIIPTIIYLGIYKDNHHYLLNYIYLISPVWVSCTVGGCSFSCPRGGSGGALLADRRVDRQQQRYYWSMDRYGVSV